MPSTKFSRIKIRPFLSVTEVSSEGLPRDGFYEVDLLRLKFPGKARVCSRESGRTRRPGNRSDGFPDVDYVEMFNVTPMLMSFAFHVIFRERANLHLLIQRWMVDCSCGSPRRPTSPDLP